MTGVKAEHIRTRAPGPALMDLIAGQYHFNFSGSSRRKSRCARASCAGWLSPRPSVSRPARSACGGRSPARFRFVGWYGVIGPAGLPEPIVARLHDEFVKVLNRPDVRERIVADGSEARRDYAMRNFRLFMASPTSPKA